MTENRMSRVWRRASDRWDRNRVPPPFDEGTTWERVEQRDSHIGVRRRIVVHLEDSIRIDDTFALAEGDFIGSWSASMDLTAPPESIWTSYTFAVGNGDPVTYACEDDTVIPRFGIYPVLVKVPFEAGHLKAITVLDDRTGATADVSHLVSVGWDEAVNGQWWRIDQYHDGERRAAYWLDAQHRLKRSDWDGAVLAASPSRSVALGDLADTLGHLFSEEPEPALPEDSPDR